MSYHPFSLVPVRRKGPRWSFADYILLRLANDKDLDKVLFVEEKVSGKVSWKKRKISVGYVDFIYPDAYKQYN
ncbi:MAG: hypothetical protein C0392_12060 [Syntrophus sp. (in: bacteria)]|nr:hypothetical protein [Syntrophus sp. (in: bacteria)]